MSALRLLRTGKGPMDGWIARGYDRGVQAALRETFSALAGDLLGELGAARRVLDAGCGGRAARETHGPIARPPRKRCA